ncbi:electron transfer flavoprotein subunit alpha/FixB family protein [Acinetobacter rathckeae]|uniref:electron transfer flavoprotein subunit alpha/FixB family protein n=1 Tax=Acinetobacter rathckeae TaxID=2605272 RepID=UPI0018A2CB7F|nr:FAD-binding protein [Acinetobacter rathckeae]MBF7687425.1 FAD-binding protein [Acinetobacter rathckeae]MBF7694826.1 FAD-binding protein [Acinetobacter rathckeae]
MSILVIAEHDNTALNGATLHVVTAAQKMGAEITLLVVGENVTAVAEQAKTVAGVAKVLVADHAVYAHQLAENVSALVVELAKGYRHVLAASTTFGKNILPRVAALLDVSMVTDVIAVESENTFKRAIYAGNAIATVQSDETVIVATVRTTAFDAVANTGGSATVEAVSIVEDAQVSRFVAEQIIKTERPELSAARVVVSGGRGVGSAENYHAVLDPLADKLGAAQGASRAAVDAGFVPNDMQVGQTGKIVAPDLYIAAGISGAIQHLAGMKDSKVIVAINKDEEAPINAVADYWLVGDLNEVVPELTAKI